MPLALGQTSDFAFLHLLTRMINTLKNRSKEHNSGKKVFIRDFPCSLYDFFGWNPSQITVISNSFFICICLLFIFKKFYYDWFTVFCQFLLYSKVTKSHIYIHSFSHIILHHLPLQVIRYTAPCAIQQNSIACLLHMQQFSSTKPRFPIHSTLSTSPRQTQVGPACPWSFLFCRWIICTIF